MKTIYKIGYTQGVFDMFHIGHLNLIKNAKARCEYLIVGINSDKLVRDYKKKSPVICEDQRKEIVESIKYVDRAVITHTLDKIEIWNYLNFNVIFIGDDWKNSERWIKTENELKKVEVEVIYLPYTNLISSSILREKQNDRVI